MATDEITAWNNAYYKTFQIYAVGWGMWFLNQTFGNNGGMVHMVFAFTSSLYAFVPFYILLLFRDIMTSYAINF